MIQNVTRLKEDLRTIECDPNEYKVVKNGPKSLVVRIKGNAKPFHFDKVTDSNRAYGLKPFDQPLRSLIIVGLHNDVRNVIESCGGDVAIFLYEPDIRLIKLLFELTDYEELLMRDNVVFSYQKDERALLDEISSVFYNRNAAFYFSNEDDSLYADLMDKLFQRLCNDRSKHLDQIESGDGYAVLLDYKEESSYNTLTYFVKQFEESFRRLNLKTKTLNYRSKNNMAWIRKERFHLLNLNVVFFFTLNGRMLYSDHHFEFDFLNKPVVLYFLDNPIHHMRRVEYDIPTGVCLWVDQNHVEFARKYFPNMRHKRLLHCGNNVMTKYEDGLFDRERTIDVLFNGSLHYQTYEEYLKGLPSNVRSFFPKFLEDYLTNGLSIEKSVEQSLNPLGHRLSKHEKLDMISLFGTLILKYVRPLKRYMAMKHMLEAGVPVTCYGNGWDETDLFHHPNLIYKETADYSKQYDIYLNTKIVINILPELKDGFHDRILSSMVAGAMCISEKSNVLSEEFIEDVDIALFDFAHIERLPALVKRYLNDGEKRVQITKNAYEKVKSNHMFIHRAKEVLSLLNV